MREEESEDSEMEIEYIETSELMVSSLSFFWGSKLIFQIRVG